MTSAWAPAPSASGGHARAAERLALRVGVDLVAIADVADSIERFGERYLRRLFTDHELACCEGDPAFRASGLAARFAAKEAAVKALRPGDVRPPWRTIEVRREQSGACGIHLSGAALALAEAAAMGPMALSITHEGPTAAAVVVGLCGPVDDGEKEMS